MEFGAFSVSLAVKDLEASRRSYETLGFRAFAGDAILISSPGWDGNAQPLAYQHV